MLTFDLNFQDLIDHPHGQTLTDNDDVVAVCVWQ